MNLQSTLQSLGLIPQDSTGAEVPFRKQDITPNPLTPVEMYMQKQQIRPQPQLNIPRGRNAGEGVLTAADIQLILGRSQGL